MQVNWRMWHERRCLNKNKSARSAGNGGAGYTCWSPRLLLLSPRHSDRHVPRSFSCRNYDTGQVYQFWKIIPLSGQEKGEGGGSGRGRKFNFRALKCLASFQTGCSFYGRESENELKKYAPDTFMSIKNHLPSSLLWQRGGLKTGAPANYSTLKPKFVCLFVFRSLSLGGKNPPNLQSCLQREESWLRLFTHAKTK